MARWQLESGWEVTNEGVPLTTLADKGYMLTKDGTTSIVEHRPGKFGRHQGHWRYIRDYKFAVNLTQHGALLSPRGEGQKTSTLEDALEGVGMSKDERRQLMQMIDAT